MLGASWKTTLFGIIVIVLGAVGPVLNHYYPVVGLDWVTLCTTLATFVGGAGLISAKDKDVHGGTVDTGTRPDPVTTAVAVEKVEEKAAEGKKP